MAFWWIIMSSLFIAVLMLILQIEFLQHATAAHDFALTLMVAIVSAIITMGTLALGVGVDIGGMSWWLVAGGWWLAAGGG